jgi:hypothetical protein
VGTIDELFVTIPFPSVDDANAYLECLHYSAHRYTLDVDVWYEVDKKLSPALIISREVH